MSWLLIAVFIGVSGDEREMLSRYPSEAACIAAAEAFVAAHPEFEFDQRPEGALVNPVVRSYVECVQEENERNK